MSKEGWRKICLDWQKYGGEYLGLIFVIICFSGCVWFFAILPANKAFEDGKRSALKTEIIRNIDGNISKISANSKIQAEEIKNRLEAIKKDDKIENFKSITVNQNGDRYEIIIIFGRD